MKEGAEREPVNFEIIQESLKGTSGQERVDVLAGAKKYADDRWFYWGNVRSYIKNQLEIIEVEAQLKLFDSL